MDINEVATHIVKTTTKKVSVDIGKNAAAVALGRLGGLKGGKARAQKLSAQRKKEIAAQAALARWSKR